MRISIQAVREGLGAVNGTRRMWFVFWFWNLAFALAFAAPVAALLVRNLGHSLYAQEMLAGFDVQWVTEFLLETRGWPAVMLGPLAIVVAAGYLLLSAFLAGGAITVFAAPEPRYVPAAFWQGCGRNFGRLFRLLVYSLPAYAVVMAVNVGLAKLGQWIWRDSMQEKPVVLFGWGRVALVLLLFLFVNMVFDYARIRLVAEDSRKSLRAALGSFRFAWRNLGPASGTYAAVLLLAAALFATYWLLCGLLPRHHLVWLLLVLLVQQAYLIARLGVRLLFFASQTGLYLMLTAPEFR
ncbi:MAG: hypothetical protein AAB225_11190, partial [Acidobacteriota bacterium]